MTTRRVKRLDELAQNIPPPRDLWPAISAAIEADKAEAAAPAQARRYGWGRPAGAMAAAVALVSSGFRSAFAALTFISSALSTMTTRRLPSSALRDKNERRRRTSSTEMEA